MLARRELELANERLQENAIELELQADELRASAQLRDRATEAEAANRAKMELLAVMSHQLRSSRGRGIARASRPGRGRDAPRRIPLRPRLALSLLRASCLPRVWSWLGRGVIAETNISTLASAKLLPRRVRPSDGRNRTAPRRLPDGQAKSGARLTIPFASSRTEDHFDTAGRRRTTRDVEYVGHRQASHG